MTEKQVKTIIGGILIIGAFIGMIICVITSTVFYFQNPDMTALRRFIEYPAPTIWAIICFVCAKIGIGLN